MVQNKIKMSRMLVFKLSIIYCERKNPMFLMNLKDLIIDMNVIMKNFVGG